MHVRRAPCFTVLHFKCFCLLFSVHSHVAILNSLTTRKFFNLYNKVKVKVTLVQATKAQRGSRGIDLLFV
jgi:hypothetical protein